MRIFTALVFMAAAVAFGQVRLGDLGPDSIVITNAVPGGVVVESDPVALPVATNALALAQSALQPGATNGMLRAEADTLATVTARGATTTNAVTIGNRGTGDVGSISLAQGCDVIASGEGSHAEGFLTKAGGDYSHAEGYESEAAGTASHAEGLFTTASGEGSHAEGSSTTASGGFSHAEGYESEAAGIASHASGFKAYIPGSDRGAFAWQGTDGSYSELQYASHGPGTFNLNPVGGLAGFWIGETTLDALLGERATWQGATNIAAAAVAGYVRTNHTGNVTVDGTVTATAFSGDGSALTGLPVPSHNSLTGIQGGGGDPFEAWHLTQSDHVAMTNMIATGGTSSGPTWIRVPTGDWRTSGGTVAALSWDLSYTVMGFLAPSNTVSDIRWQGSCVDCSGWTGIVVRARIAAFGATAGNSVWGHRAYTVGSDLTRASTLPDNRTYAAPAKGLFDVVFTNIIDNATGVWGGQLVRRNVAEGDSLGDMRVMSIEYMPLMP